MIHTYTITETSGEVFRVFITRSGSGATWTDNEGANSFISRHEAAFRLLDARHWHCSITRTRATV